MSAALDALLFRLRGVRRNGDGFVALCPAHEDHKPSLSVKNGERAVVVKCHAGCPTKSVLAEIGFTMRDLHFDSPANTNGNHAKRFARQPRIVATYPYVNETGALLFEVQRFEPKDFRQRRPNGNGGWIRNLDGVSRVLYRLPEVLNATEVLVVEGERDVESARSWGMCATTGGSASSPWLSEYTEVLAGKHVAVIADVDTPGRKKAREIEQALLGKAKSVRVLEMPGANKKGWDLSDWMAAGGTRERLIELVNATPESKVESIEGAALLDGISAYIRRFVSLIEAQAQVVALWVGHTHAIDAADATPYLAITSPVKRSGKTRLLEILNTVVANPWMTGRTTAAALVRKIDKEGPTLLLDESDAAFKGEKEYAEALRGVLNSGHERSGRASLCVGQGANIEVKDFMVFCPKAVAGIGGLPDTVADRAIPIRLKRKARSERVERFRLRNVEAEAARLRGLLAGWVTPLIERLREARPTLPDELSDRQQDGAEPLLAIADAAGGDWPQVARRALVELFNEAQGADDSIGEKLLADIRQILGAQGQGRITSADLVASLAKIETSPWSEWSNGKPLSQAKLARLLHPFGITTKTNRFTDRTLMSYEREHFQDAFDRYLTLENPSPSPYMFQSKTSKTPNNPNDLEAISKQNKKIDVFEVKHEIANNGNDLAACFGVSLSNPPTGGGAHGEEVPDDHRRCAGCYVVDSETGAKIHPPKNGVGPLAVELETEKNHDD